LPPFADVRKQVADDYANERTGKYRKQAIDDLLRHYRVEPVGLPADEMPEAARD
jgi:hypothetical protein